MKNCPCRITSAQIHLNVKHYSMKLEGNDLFLCDSYDLYNDNMHWACWPPGPICNFKFFLTTQIILNCFFKHFQCPKLIKYMLHVIKRNLSSPNVLHLFFFQFCLTLVSWEKKNWKKEVGTPGLHALIGELPSPWALHYTCHPLAFLSSLTCLCSLECKIELEQMNGKSLFPKVSGFIHIVAHIVAKMRSQDENRGPN